MTTFTLKTPATLGTLAAPVTVKALQITSIRFTTTPGLAQVGSGELDITLTETTNGWQNAVSYQDTSVLAFFAQAAPATPAGATVEDVMCGLIFAKLIADGKLPAGTLTTSPLDTATDVAPTAATPTGTVTTAPATTAP
jgi:hypothetical protein